MVPLLFLGYSLNVVPGRQAASAELVQKKEGSFCKEIITQITVEIIMLSYHNLKWATVHCFSSVCGIAPSAMFYSEN